MIRWLVLVVSFCAAALSGCGVVLTQQGQPFPRIEETGGPKELYSVRDTQVTVLFQPGMTLGQIIQRYGEPAKTGQSPGNTGSWAEYTYGRTYTNVDSDFKYMRVNRFSTAMLFLDGDGVVKTVQLQRSQKFDTDDGMRIATDEEVVRYLGPPEKLGLPSVAEVESPQGVAVTGDAVKSQGVWKLGVEVRDLTSELRKRAGYPGQGVYVVDVDPQGLAARAGVRTGDVVVMVNGAFTPSRADLTRSIKAAKVSSDLALKVFSRGRLIRVSIPARTTAGETSSL